jgi:hypothetical protein
LSSRRGGIGRLKRHLPMVGRSLDETLPEQIVDLVLSDVGTNSSAQ